MEYTINKLAQISGVSTRTLRYYDQIELLNPKRVSSNGYRIYGSAEIDRLQQILFYRELGVGLEEIKAILSSPGFDTEKALEAHLHELTQKKERLELLIETVSRTIGAIKGEYYMRDHEKFEGFKQNLIEENEKQYGKEIRKKYGNDTVDASSKKLASMTKEKWEEAQALSGEINETLKAALLTGDASGELAQKACDLHRRWLCMFWKDGTYSKQAHLGLGEMYVEDERFKAYYDKIADGAAEFLRDALRVYCNQ